MKIVPITKYINELNLKLESLQFEEKYKYLFFGGYFDAIEQKNST